MDFCIGISGFLSKELEKYTGIVNRIGLDKAEILFGIDSNSSPQLYCGMTKRDIEKAKKIFDESRVMPVAYCSKCDALG